MKINSSFTEEEFKMDCPMERDHPLSLFITIFTIILFLSFAYIAGEFLHPYVPNTFIFLIGLIIGYFLFDSFFWSLRGHRKFIIDKKYLIVFETKGVYYKNRAYEMSEISKITTKKVNKAFFYKIKTFWTKGIDNSISFTYKEKKINLGVNVSEEESMKLVSALKKYALLSSTNSVIDN